MTDIHITIHGATTKHNNALAIVLLGALTDMGIATDHQTFECLASELMDLSLEEMRDLLRAKDTSITLHVKKGICS